MLIFIAGLGGKFNRHHYSIVTLCVVWCLIALVFIHGYVGTLAPMLSVMKLKPVISRLEDLPKSGLNWAVLSGTDLDSLFMVVIYFNSKANCEHLNIFVCRRQQRGFIK